MVRLNYDAKAGRCGWNASQWNCSFCWWSGGACFVGREEILERVWGKDVFVDIDNSINTAVRKIRQALGDDPENSRFVQTVPGKGYRFAAKITTDQPSATSPFRSEQKVESLDSGAKRREQKAAVWLGFVPTE